MKTAALLAAASVLLASSLMVSIASAQTSPPSGNVRPPPGINDPGAHAVAPAHAATVRAPASGNGSRSAQSTAVPSMHDAGAARDARGEPPPEISVHQRGEDSVQEYRRNGQVYMVVITSKAGIAQTYMVDPQGRLVDEHGQKPVRPVMYKVLEWGKSKPASAQSSTPPGDRGH